MYVGAHGCSLSLMPLGPGLGQPLSQLSCCPAGIWLVCFAPSLHSLQHTWARSLCFWIGENRGFALDRFLVGTPR